MKYAIVCEPGGRAVNEDSACVKVENNKLIAVVADGLGSHGGGKTASETAVKSLCDNFAKLTSFNKVDVEYAFDKANASVLKMQTSMVKMKSTAVVIAADTEKRQYMFAHIGDSRLYYFSNGSIVFQTKDHSVSRIKVDMGDITQEQIRFDCDRNKLLRALGVSSEKLKTVINLTENNENNSQDAFLLCSDGFWEYVLENEMEECLKKSSSPDEWLNSMLMIHNSRADDKCDNYTAIVLVE